ncbi:hypothetical protein [Cohnella yongneupensis]|uniref:Uncharacterized protein n=1 Tax=Cohnella yongneupensis TaxID=425006 RepID=A0ABW0QV19_9BACL
MITIATGQREPAKLPEFRISNSETMQNKLVYQIRTGNMDANGLNRLQSQCMNELHQLRSELDELLQELREIANPTGDHKNRERIAA